MAVDARHCDYLDYDEEWAIIRDVIRGERAVKNKGPCYLPKTPGMVSDSLKGDARYEEYKKRADLPDIVRPAVDAAVGVITKKDAVFLRPDGGHWEAMEMMATPDGEDIFGFHALLAREMISVGRAGFVVNMRTDSVTGDAVPTFVMYTAEQIIDWAYDVKNGSRFLSYLAVEYMVEGPPRLAEKGVERTKDRFVDQYILDPDRGCFLYRWRYNNEDETKEESEKWEPVPARQPLSSFPRQTEQIATPDNGVGYRLDFIPFVGLNTERLSLVPTGIPFIGLARNALSRYRQSASYYEALSFYEPTPYVTGMTDEWIRAGFAPKRFGAGVVWHLPQGATAGMVEYTGPAIANMRLAMQDLEQQALFLAFTPFEPKAAVGESGVAKQERRHDRGSLIHDIAQNIGRAINRGIDLAANWLGESADEDRLWFKVSQELTDYFIDAQAIAALMSAWQSRAMSKQTLHENFEKAGLTRFTFDEEEEMISQEDPLEGEVDDFSGEDIEPLTEDEPPPQEEERGQNARRAGPQRGQ